MKLLTSSEIKKLNDKEIEDEIFNIKKTLFDFRMKRATKQLIKPHLFKLYKRQLAKILTITSNSNYINN
uniref:Large ribosomal subunit protein uL29c n=1 Tax=Batrachospermum sp. TaxID=31373 RepID=A0A8K1YV49_9FLOR|nr:ribosomal protein L29 [Batrachospermum sp.]